MQLKITVGLITNLCKYNSRFFLLLFIALSLSLFALVSYYVKLLFSARLLSRKCAKLSVSVSVTRCAISLRWDFLKATILARDIKDLHKLITLSSQKAWAGVGLGWLSRLQIVFHL